MRLPDIGQSAIVCLQSWMGTYLCALNGGGDNSIVVANRASVGPWEQFRMERIDADHVTLQTLDGYYLCADSGGGSIVVADRVFSEEVPPGEWENFSVHLDLNGLLSFSCSNGSFLCADQSGILVANAQAIGPWEKFYLISHELANEHQEQTRVEINVYRLPSPSIELHSSTIPTVHTSLPVSLPTPPLHPALIDMSMESTLPLWHTGIVIDGREYYFDMNDHVESLEHPGSMTIELHRTMYRFVPENLERVMGLFEAVRRQWDGTEYDLTTHNCNLFVEEVLRAFGVQGLDREYLESSGLRTLAERLPGTSVVQEIFVIWPIDERRFDEAAMRDLEKFANVPAKFAKFFTNTISDVAKQGQRAISDVAEQGLQAIKDAGKRLEEKGRRILPRW